MNTSPNKTPRPPLSQFVLTSEQLASMTFPEVSTRSQAVPRRRLWRHWYDPYAGPPGPHVKTPDGVFADELPAAAPAREETSPTSPISPGGYTHAPETAQPCKPEACTTSTTAPAELLTQVQMARMLGISRRTLATWVRNKTVPMIKVRGFCRFDPAKVRAALEQHEQAAASSSQVTTL